MKKSAHSSETLVTTHQITLYHILADQRLKTYLTPHVGCTHYHDMALITSCSQYQQVKVMKTGNLAHKIWTISFEETDILGDREAQGKR